TGWRLLGPACPQSRLTKLTSWRVPMESGRSNLNFNYFTTLDDCITINGRELLLIYGAGLPQFAAYNDASG
ncbi:MAG: hypothetical protein ACREBV_09895, partial [Candidatus Zixiibacteriota bacterium]